MVNANDSRTRIALIIFLIFLFLAPFAYADEIVTVTTTDGEIYEDVTYKVNRYYKTIKLEKEEFEKNVSFGKIASIIDAEGTDITARVLGSYYKAEKEQWVSRKSKMYKKATAKPWQGILRLGLNFSIPTGDYYEGIGSGVGFEGDLRYAVTNHLSIRGGISKSGMKSSSDPVFYSTVSYIEVVDTDFRINAIRYLFGAEYYARATRGDDARDYWFLLCYLGAINHHMELRVTLENTNTGEQLTDTIKDKESKFLFGFGFGITKLLEKNYGLEMGFTFEFVPVGTRPSELYGQETVYAYIIDFKLGFVGFAL